MQRWYYSVDTTTVLEITDRVRLPTDDNGEDVAVGSHAEAGSGWQGEINVDDPDGDLIMLCHRRIYCVQDAAPADEQVVGNWFIQDLDVVQMDPFTGTARTWIVQMADENSLLSRRIFVGGDSIRPAETDIERIQWALTTTELNTLDPDEDFIDTAGAVPLDAADLTGQTPEQMLAHCMSQSGKNYWVMYREDLTPNVFVLAYFNPNTSTLYPSTRSLSNVAAEIGDSSTVSAIGDNTRLNRAGGRIASGAYKPYDRQDAGPPYVYEQKPSTGVTYVPRDVALPSINDKTAATASAGALRELDELDEPDDEVTTTVQVWEEQVNEIMHGMSVPFHATYLPNFTEGSARPGYAVGNSMRVMRRTVRQVAPTVFNLGLVLSPMPPNESVLLAVVYELYATTPSGTLTVTADTGGPAWTLLGESETTDNDYPGVGTVSLLKTSLWWIELPASPTNAAYVTPRANTIGGAWVFQLGGIDSAGVAGATVFTDNADEANGTDHALGTGAADNVLFGGYGIALLAYAYGLEVTPLAGTTLAVAADQDNDPDYTASADIFPPWCVVAHRQGVGSIGTHIDPSPTYNPYTTLHQAGVAARIPLVGTFSVMQSAHNNGGLHAAFGVTLPGPL